MCPRTLGQPHGGISNTWKTVQSETATVILSIQNQRSSSCQEGSSGRAMETWPPDQSLEAQEREAHQGGGQQAHLCYDR